MHSSLCDRSLLTVDPISGKNSTGNLTTPSFNPIPRKQSTPSYQGGPQLFTGANRKVCALSLGIIKSFEWKKTAFATQHTRICLRDAIAQTRSNFATLCFPSQYFQFSSSLHPSQRTWKLTMYYAPLVTCILQPADGAIMYRSDRCFRYN